MPSPPYCNNSLWHWCELQRSYKVIHFGPPQSIEAYLEESGRCGREGEQSDALLLYNGINARVADADMKSYIKSTTCQRQFL